ncbi:hypothetical protein [Sphingomicrobium lutaoense]|uniref:Uncharacterized protein n=1 Tax=Sphingomicrobium lutaoense TaxID=515949 RepID=A0A839Z3X9_9SPHN|nr:hypothetical protein [Sphingomicrobium lutaoense]MBB3763304.1 hypothetical protein [Sphingomicrobium lutaoense]
MRNKKKLLCASAFAALLFGGVAIGQDRPESLLPPGFDEPPPPPPPPSPEPAPPPAPQPRVTPPASTGEASPVADEDGGDEEEGLAARDGLENSEVDADDDDLSLVAAPGGALRFEENLFARSPARMAVSLMRKLELPLASRWGHIALRNAILSAAVPPKGIRPSDWVAERAWLLVRMGEADAARLLLASAPDRRSNARLAQVRLQVALASSDMGSMCPTGPALDDNEPKVAALVEAFCSAMLGQPELATETLRRERRRGRLAGIDLSLADKLIGAGSGTGRSATIEWDNVDTITSWRYGLATASGMSIPERLMEPARPRVHAWYARNPLIAPEERLPSARIAAGTGVFSGQAMLDLFGLAYADTDPDALGESPAFRLRQSFVGETPQARVSAMRQFWSGSGSAEIEQVGGWVTTSKAAALISPASVSESDAAPLLASILTAGYDRRLMQWVPAVEEMDEDEVDLAWGLVALGAPSVAGLDLSEDRIRDFIRRDDSRAKQRSRLLVAGLAGLGRIDARLAAELEEAYALGVVKESSATRLMARASRLNDMGSVSILSALLLQAPSVDALNPHFLRSAVTAMREAGQPFIARMIAAEALSRA